MARKSTQKNNKQTLKKGEKMNIQEEGLTKNYKGKEWLERQVDMERVLCAD